MEATSHAYLGHLIAAIGEALNFIGALVLALDLLRRGRESTLTKKLARMGDWGRRHRLSATYRAIPVSDLEFEERVLARGAAQLAYLGLGLLAFGFLLLVGHHLLAILWGE
jgi:hypothetical protein